MRNACKNQVGKPSHFFAGPILLAALVAGLSLIPLQRSTAGVLIIVQQVGPDVVSSASGSLDTSALVFNLSTGSGAQLIPNEASVVVGTGGAADWYSLPSAFPNFGPGTQTFASSGSGPSVGAFGFGANLVVPGGYVSGSPISSSATFNGATLASLGLTPGTYSTSWGTGPSADSLTLTVVPEASESLIVLLGMTGLLAGRRRKR